jgi:repressor of nif and glnA expression
VVAGLQRPKARAHLAIDHIKNDKKYVVTTPVSQQANKLVCPDERKLVLTALQRGASITAIGRTAVRRDSASDQIQSLYSRGAQ